MQANIGTCAMFAATSGSSVATAATVGVVALPQVKIRRYDEPLFLGTLAAGGTLGILIPPSINFILYGLLTQTSVPRLYLAGMIPGLLLTAFFMAHRPGLLPAEAREGRHAGGEQLGERLRSLKDLVAPLFIFAVVVGSIYAGWATPTGSGVHGRLRGAGAGGLGARAVLVDDQGGVRGTMRTTAMIMLIIIAAQFLNFVLANIGVTDGVAKTINELGLGKVGTMLLLVVFYLILGCFMETISMMILTTPFVFLIVVGLGWIPSGGGSC